LVSGVLTGVSTLPLSVPRGVAPLAVGPGSQRPTLAGGRFVAGPENRLLLAVLQRWCPLLEQHAPETTPQWVQSWARLVSPLVLVGPTGCGKTHLAEGIAQVAGPRATCTTANDLRRDFADAIDRGIARQWRERWARYPVLVVDDIDHLAPTVNFQQELVCLFDEIADRGHKLIATSARPLAHLRGWSPNLINRFSAGLTLEISPLEPATRAEVLGDLAQMLAWKVEPDTLALLAHHAPEKPRELITWIGQLQQQFAPRTELTAAGVEEFVKRTKARSAPDLQQIIRLVSRYYGIPQKVLVSASRQASAVAARSMVVYLARQLTTASYEQIAQRLGGRDHTTILHNYHRICERLNNEPALRQASDELQALLRR
jgi:chromosomal replication initiator protein